ncbi:hypothetical protein KDA_13070 [Dictyobacter alpinus]|uniref:TPM domain-containing protein n=1 Tax=Dictyobacter alpinus TaxID=2014873 RepID=A0A402B3B0_9CHLR|nr:hypothetical protein [Dictyobacter alpinus]GCE25823.1 hypothetical protein KDA_13070 [Dictyobacter alpinus]
MDKTSSGSLIRRSSKGVVATFVALCLIAISATAALANSVNIYDNAGVLNRSQVQSAASSLSKPIDIYAVNSTGSSSAFDQTAKRSIKNADMIVIAFNPNHVSIVGGKNVGLSTSQYKDATNAFTSTIKSSNQNFTSATVAAIDSLRGSLNNSNSFIPGVGGGAGSSIFGTLCCVGLIALLAIAAFAIFRRRRGGNMGNGGFGNFGGGFFNRRPNQTPYNQGPNYQGNYPPNYQGNYPPNYQGNYPPQQGGMNPWAAGGLGAAAGGLVGYELGKNAGENDRGNEGGFGGGASSDFGGGGDGGFGSGDGGFGGGASSDFGGGGGDGGFGGGDGGFGGGDSGGGGGDFGGGAGGDF